MTLAEQTETAWQSHYAARAALEQALHAAFDYPARTMGLPTSGVATFVALACDVVAGQDPTGLKKLASTWHDAKVLEEQRNAEVEAAAHEPPAPPAPFLDTTEPEVVRDALKTATAAEVDEWLNTVAEATQRREWAARLREWAAADGNRADVIAALDAHDPPTPESVPAPTLADVDTTGTGQQEPVGSGGGDAETGPDSVEDAQVADALEIIGSGGGKTANDWVITHEPVPDLTVTVNPTLEDVQSEEDPDEG